MAPTSRSYTLFIHHEYVQVNFIRFPPLQHQTLSRVVLILIFRLEFSPLERLLAARRVILVDRYLWLMVKEMDVTQ